MARSKRKSSTRKGFRTGRRSGGGVFWYALGAIIALGLLGAAGFWQFKTSREMAFDTETLCPSPSGPVAMTAILFDLTDPLTKAQSNQLAQYIEQEFSSAAAGTQFTMGVVSEDAASWGATEPLCKPIMAQDASALTQNLAMVRDRYEAGFIAPMRRNLAHMTSATGANSSPIMESLQGLVADSRGFLTFSGARKLIVVSDLLQHSDVMSFYRGDDWQSFAASHAYQRLGHTLSGAEIMLFAVPRDVERIRDPAVIEDFWLRYFDLQGAKLPRFRALGDL